MRSVWLVTILLAVAASHGLCAEDLVVERAEAGYRLTRPDARWKVRPTPAPPNAHHALRLELEPAPAEVTISVFAADVPAGANAESLAASSAAGWKAKATGAVTTETSTVASASTPTITWDLETGGVRLRVRQHYLVREGELLVIQCVAPTATFERHETAFAAALVSFALLPRDRSRSEARGLRMLAARCGSEVPRARTWTEASARATREHRLVLVSVELFRGLPIPPLADTTTFMDDDVVALCRERFVVLPWTDALDAPFERPEVFGLGPHTFGPAVLFVTPEGRVLDSLGLLEPTLVDERACAVLSAHPEFGGAPFDPADAAAALARGDLERADELLKAPTSATSWRQRAALLRRRHLGDDALAALARAEQEGGDARELAADRGLVLLRAGRPAEAAVALRAAGALPAARYWLCVTRALHEGLEPVRADLRALASDMSAGRFGWRAAAMALGRGPASGVEALVSPDATLRATIAPRPFESSPTVDAERAAADALAFLLRTQRVDGTWAVPAASTPDPTASPTIAVTAIAGAALLRHRGSPAVDAAVARAHVAVARAHDRLLRTHEGVFDYAVWARIHVLRFLAASVHGAPAEEATRLRAAAEAIATEMSWTRAPGGGWSYANLAGAGLSADNSISFLTASGLLSLRAARDAGVALTPLALSRGAAVLAALRREAGSFAYQTATPGVADPSEAAFRGPLCLLALRRAARGDATEPGPSIDDLKVAVTALLSASDAALREAGKPLCHTAPDGTSAYYLIFGLRYAAEVLRELPPEARGTLSRGLRDAVLRLRRHDGSFCDFPPIGPAYGTAMALETLDLLTDAAVK